MLDPGYGREVPPVEPGVYQRRSRKNPGENAIAVPRLEQLCHVRRLDDELFKIGLAAKHVVADQSRTCRLVQDNQRIRRSKKRRFVLASVTSVEQLGSMRGCRRHGSRRKIAERDFIRAGDREGLRSAASPELVDRPGRRVTRKPDRPAEINCPSPGIALGGKAGFRCLADRQRMRALVQDRDIDREVAVCHRGDMLVGH